MYLDKMYLDKVYLDKMSLDKATFCTVVAGAPLVSMDFLVRNRQGELLLGMRNNRPAQGYWFVPGGRIMKGETLDDAFRRLASEELDCPCERTEANFFGLFEHHYEDSVFGNEPSTHYVVLAYQLQLDMSPNQMPAVQHNRYRWLPLEEADNAADIHPYTRAYIESLVTGVETGSR